MKILNRMHDRFQTALLHQHFFHYLINERSSLSRQENIVVNLI